MGFDDSGWDFQYMEDKIGEIALLATRLPTKRELFAAMAMMGRIANGDKWDQDNIALYAVQQADALIAELSKEKTP